MLISEIQPSFCEGYQLSSLNFLAIHILEYLGFLVVTYMTE